jgi:hypothetical protein
MLPKPTRRRRSKSLDGRILSAVAKLANPVSVQQICALLYPELSWEVARSQVRAWPQFGGAIATTAWLIHWRCRVMSLRGLMRVVDRIETDLFVGLR